MIKRLTRVGNSLGLIIDRPILELLDIDQDTELEIRTDGRQLVIRPLRGDTDAESQPRGDLRETARSFLDEFRKALK